jgi:hypothetical protein
MKSSKILDVLLSRDLILAAIILAIFASRVVEAKSPTVSKTTRAPASLIPPSEVPDMPLAPPPAPTAKNQVFYYGSCNDHRGRTHFSDQPTFSNCMSGSLPGSGTTNTSAPAYMGRGIGMGIVIR